MYCVDFKRRTWTFILRVVPGQDRLLETGRRTSMHSNFINGSVLSNVTQLSNTFCNFTNTIFSRTLLFGLIGKYLESMNLCRNHHCIKWMKLWSKLSPFAQVEIRTLFNKGLLYLRKIFTKSYGIFCIAFYFCVGFFGYIAFCNQSFGGKKN